MSKNLLIGGLAMLFAATGCAGPRGKTVADKRSHVQHMRQTTLESIESTNPDLAAKARNAAGYGIFTNVGVAWLIGGGGKGYGVVVNNKTGEETYMKVVRGSLGLGIGLKEYKVLVILDSAETLNKFVTSGWEFGGEAAATATTSKTGGTLDATGSMSRGIEVYQFTDRGLYARISVQAAKVYPDKKLNAG